MVETNEQWCNFFLISEIAFFFYISYLFILKNKFSDIIKFNFDIKNSLSMKRIFNELIIDNKNFFPISENISIYLKMANCNLCLKDL